ncbi:MAG TPA: hypothetical protein VGE50_08435 [Gammaproteobacteria bacterium]
MKRIKAGIVVAPLVLMLCGCGGSYYSNPDNADDGRVEVPSQPSASDASDVLERWGIEYHGVRLTAAGYLLDFRYRVKDAKKAAPLLDRHAKTYVIVEKSDAKLGVPVSDKIGALRSSTKNIHEENNYFIMFSNPGRHVQSGDRVRVVIGDLVTEPLTVM